MYRKLLKSKIARSAFAVVVLAAGVSMSNPALLSLGVNSLTEELTPEE